MVSKPTSGVRLPVFAQKAILDARDSQESAAIGILAEGRTLTKLRELTENAGALSDQVSSLFPQGPTDCKAGCSYCCQVPVEVTVPEAVTCLDYARKRLPLAQLARIEEQIHEVGERVSDITSTEDYPNVPCPLLIDDRCSVYPVRPLLCRGMNSSDVNACKNGFASVKMNYMQWALPQEVQLGLALGVIDSGLHGLSVNLAAALKLLVDEPDSLPRWLSGEDSFAAARLEITAGTRPSELTLLASPLPAAATPGAQVASKRGPHLD